MGRLEEDDVWDLGEEGEGVLGIFATLLTLLPFCFMLFKLHPPVA